MLLFIVGLPVRSDFIRRFTAERIFVIRVLDEWPSIRMTLRRVPPKVHYIPHTSLRQSKVGKIRGFVDTTLIAHKPLP